MGLVHQLDVGPVRQRVTTAPHTGDVAIHDALVRIPRDDLLQEGVGPSRDAAFLRVMVTGLAIRARRHLLWISTRNIVALVTATEAVTVATARHNTIPAGVDEVNHQVARGGRLIVEAGHRPVNSTDHQEVVSLVTVQEVLAQSTRTMILIDWEEQTLLVVLPGCHRQPIRDSLVTHMLVPGAALHSHLLARGPLLLTTLGDRAPHSRSICR